METCAKLVEAPDSDATLRLEADLILSEKRLSEKQADLTERTRALVDMIKRYRNTPAEAKSLMTASFIAPKLEAFDLEQTIIKTLSERFQGDHDIIEFRRKTSKPACSMSYSPATTPHNKSPFGIYIENRENFRLNPHSGK